MRLKICIDIASGLAFLHGTASSSEMVIHGDISSSNILLFDDWKSKNLRLLAFLVVQQNQNVDYVNQYVMAQSVLFDILCGKLSSEKAMMLNFILPFLAKHYYHVDKLDKLVFKGIKQQIVPQSFITFAKIAFQCIHHMRERRPTAHEVVIQLEKALEFQEDYEKWEPKLPKDYKEIIQMSKCPDDYSTIKKEELYNIFSNGILLQQDK
ncbi:kinase-like domain, phloem protein 2-like protein [Tanacetum coccineum]